MKKSIKEPVRLRERLRPSLIVAAEIERELFLRRRNRQRCPVKFRHYVYNPKRGTVLGRRNATAWLIVCAFYCVFYLMLTALVAVCMYGLYQTLDPRIPKWILKDSIIGTSPGISVRPLPNDLASTLIWYNSSDPVDYKNWTESLNDFMYIYKFPGIKIEYGEKIYNCDYTHSSPPEGQNCDVNISNMGPCTMENNYNYHKGAPCIFLKLNKIYGWIPEFYNDTADLPTTMPKDLKTYIAALYNARRDIMNTIWVSCDGVKSEDKNNIGSLEYLPLRGFPGYFYPYLNNPGYLSPLVAVHFQNPAKGVLINIECKAWARNIINNKEMNMGSIYFELLVD